MHSHLASHSGNIKKVDVHMMGDKSAAAMVVFKDKAKRGPMFLRLVKSEGSWRVVS